MVDKYEDAVKLLEALEPGSGRPESSSVDISSLMSRRIREGTASYEGALSLMSAAASRHGMPREQEQQPKAASPTLLQTGLQKKARYEREFAKQAGNVRTELRETVRRLNQGQPAAAGRGEEVREPVPAPAARQEKRRKRRGLGYAVRKLEVEGSRALAVRKVGEGDLVLPRLSVTDQIGELEKIITGLKEGAFDQDQLDIVEDELYGLAKALRKGRAQPVVAESNLTALRNQRLREATKELESYLIRSGK